MVFFKIIKEGAHIGPEPMTNRFVVVMSGTDERSVPGNTIAVQADMPFSGLTTFGTAFLSKFECSQMPHLNFEKYSGAIGWGLQGATSGMEGAKEQIVQESKNSTLPSQDEEAAIKKKYGGIIPKKPPLISKDHERAYFDSADWALGKQGVEKPKGPLEALRPKLQPTQQQTRYRKSPCAPADGAGGGSAQPEGGTAEE